MLKRTLDLFCSGMGLLLLLPVFLIISILVMLDGGSPFYTQKRIGRHNKPFQMIKFRSMIKNAENLGGYSTTTNDKRITKVGKYIRRTSVDEIPQLINVLKGDMSLIGPRPNVLEQKKLYKEDDWNLRHSIRPGITGLAQSTLRSSATEDQRLALDLEYVQKQNFKLDLMIIWQTIKQIIRKGGN